MKSSGEETRARHERRLCFGVVVVVVAWVVCEAMFNSCVAAAGCEGVSRFRGNIACEPQLSGCTVGSGEASVPATRQMVARESVRRTRYGAQE